MSFTKKAGKFMKKSFCLVLTVLFAAGMLACSGQYGLGRTAFPDQAEVIAQLAQETPVEEYPLIGDITSTDEFWEAYLLSGMGDQKASDGLRLDDNIVTVLPKYFFMTPGTHSYIGTEWGFYVHTTEYEPGINNSDVFLFDVEYKNVFSEWYYLSLYPALEYQYHCVLEYEDGEDPEDSARVFIVDGGEEPLGRYFLSRVALTIGNESANSRNNEVFADHVSGILCYFDAQVLGDSGDERFFASMTPNHSEDTALSVWKINDFPDPDFDLVADTTNKVEIRIADDLSTHEFYFGQWVEAASFGVYGIQDIVNGDQIWNDLDTNETYFPGQPLLQNPIVPIEYAVGDVVPSAIVLGMDPESKMEMCVEMNRSLPSYYLPGEEGVPMWVSNEKRAQIAISLDVLYQCKDGTLVKMASVTGEHRDVVSAQCGDTMILCEAAFVSVHTPGFSDEFRFYVDSDGEYLFLNSGFSDSSEIYIIDSHGQILYDVTERELTVSLEASELYYVVAKYQDDTKTGEYRIAFWPK